MSRYRTCLVALLTASMMLFGGMAVEAAKKKKGGGGKSKTTALRSAATRANAALSSADIEVRACGKALQQAVERLDRVVKEHKQVERAILKKLDSDHAFWRNWQRYEEARESYQAAVSQALSSEQYQAALNRAKEAGKSNAAMADLRQETVDTDPAVSRSRAIMHLAKDAIERARREVIDQDPEWDAAAFAVRSAREDIKRAGDDLDSALNRRSRARASFGKAARAVAIGEAAQRQFKSEGSAKKKGGSGKGSSKKKSKSGKKK